MFDAVTCYNRSSSKHECGGFYYDPRAMNFHWENGSNKNYFCPLIIAAHVVPPGTALAFITGVAEFVATLAFILVIIIVAAFFAIIVIIAVVTFLLLLLLLLPILILFVVVIIITSTTSVSLLIRPVVISVIVLLFAFLILLLIITVFAVNVRSAALRRRTVWPNLFSVALAWLP